jgi:hypothetical protein
VFRKRRYQLVRKHRHGTFGGIGGERRSQAALQQPGRGFHDLWNADFDPAALRSAAIVPDLGFAGECRQQRAVVIFDLVFQSGAQDFHGYRRDDGAQGRLANDFPRDENVHEPFKMLLCGAVQLR